MRLVHSAVRMDYLGPVSEAVLALPMMATRICLGFPSPAYTTRISDIPTVRA